MYNRDISILLGKKSEYSFQIGNYLKERGCCVYYSDHSPLNIQLEVMKQKPDAVFVSSLTKYSYQLCENVKNMEEPPCIVLVSENSDYCDTTKFRSCADIIVCTGTTPEIIFDNLKKQLSSKSSFKKGSDKADVQKLSGVESIDDCESFSPSEVHQIITDVMNKLCITPNYHGYSYIREAVKLAMKCSTASRGISKQIYPEIAQLLGVTPSGVERNIRTAIHRAWPKVDVSVKTNLFGTYALNDSWTPTNSEFIFIIADRVYCHMRLKV